MANLLLGVTGSVAAIKTPLVFETLRRAGHAVKVVATQASLVPSTACMRLYPVAAGHPVPGLRLLHGIDGSRK